MCVPSVPFGPWYVTILMSASTSRRVSSRFVNASNGSKGKVAPSVDVGHQRPVDARQPMLDVPNPYRERFVDSLANEVVAVEGEAHAHAREEEEVRRQRSAEDGRCALPDQISRPILQFADRLRPLRLDHLLVNRMGDLEEALDVGSADRLRLKWRSRLGELSRLHRIGVDARCGDKILQL